MAHCRGARRAVASAVPNPYIRGMSSVGKWRITRITAAYSFFAIKYSLECPKLQTKVSL